MVLSTAASLPKDHVEAKGLAKRTFIYIEGAFNNTPGATVELPREGMKSSAQFLNGHSKYRENK